MKKFLVLFLLICSMASAQPATPKYGQNIPPGGVLGFYPDNGKFYALPVNASGALLVDSGEVPLWELNASGVVETLGNRAIDALSLQLSSDGTAAAPSVSFGSDPKTGIYRYGADTIGFSTAEWPTLRLTSGDTNAAIMLARTASSAIGFQFKDLSLSRNCYIGMDNDTGNRYFPTGSPYSLNISTESAFPVIFGTTNAERMRIAAGGNVLINTTTDDGANKLQVNGNAAISNGASTAKILAADSMTTQLAIDGVYAIPGLVGVSQYANYTVLITNKSAPAAAKFWVSTTVVEEQDPSNLFTTTKDNPGTLNVYGEFGELRIQNKLGYAAAVNAVAFGTNS